MKIEDIIKQPEGRRLEFKEHLPPGSNLARTVIAFSNDAGGEIYLGVKDETREYAGLDPDTIIQLEEQIRSMIFDQCAPVISPEFTVIEAVQQLISLLFRFREWGVSTIN